MPSSMLTSEEWRCPLCLDLLFKPAVSSACGHIYCFWCLHKAMSPYTPSACPVCRTKYNQLPAICAKLHHYLATQFPEQYAARRQETEGASGSSPTVAVSNHHMPDVLNHMSVAFACS